MVSCSHHRSCRVQSWGDVESEPVISCHSFSICKVQADMHHVRRGASSFEEAAHEQRRMIYFVISPLFKSLFALCSYLVVCAPSLATGALLVCTAKVVVAKNSLLTLGIYCALNSEGDKSHQEFLNLYCQETRHLTFGLQHFVASVLLIFSAGYGGSCSSFGVKVTQISLRFSSSKRLQRHPVQQLSLAFRFLGSARWTVQLPITVPCGVKVQITCDTKHANINLVHNTKRAQIYFHELATTTRRVSMCTRVVHCMSVSQTCSV